MCEQKKNGGIGIKDVRVMNVCLLAKWRWRLLDGVNVLWKDVLEEKYSPCRERLFEGGALAWPRYTSVWWKDLVKLDDFGGLGWFNDNILRKVGNGMKMSFWKVKWWHRASFTQLYPSLFMISSQKEALVGEIGVASKE